MGGVIVDAGTFKWDAKLKDGSPKFPLLTEPSECIVLICYPHTIESSFYLCRVAYHGLEYYKALGPLTFILRCRSTLNLYVIAKCYSSVYYSRCSS